MGDMIPDKRWHGLSFAVEQLGRSHGRLLLKFAVAAGLLLTGAVLATFGLVLLAVKRPPVEARAVQVTSRTVQVADGGFQPPAESTIPDGPQGDAIRRGRAIFTDTRLNAMQYVGSDLSCSSCHLDGGRQADSSPMWAAWVSYPKYRTKDDAISTMEDRIRGCFVYSMNAQYSPAGEAPPPGSDIYRDLQTYFYWLAQGAPTGTKLAGAGYPTPPLPVAGYDPTRGAIVYEQNCSACHGVDGTGQRNADGSVTIPPLWGDRSFNWGAGMARVDLAAGFIKANMPLGMGDSLDDQDAWDVAAYIDSQERPRDPRQTGTVSENARLNFADQHSYYGKVVGDRVLGVGTRRR